MGCYCCKPSYFGKDNSSLHDLQLKLHGDATWVKKHKKNLKVRDLGSGGHGKTQLWHLPGLDAPVVLKVILNTETGTKDMLREVDIMRLLDGAGGAPYVLCTYPEDRCYFMTYVGAENLRDLIYKQLNGLIRLEDLFWLRVIEDVIVKLNEIHQKGVVHGDFKSNNIIIDRSDPGKPRAAIIDFGISVLQGQVVTKRQEPQQVEKLLTKSPWYAYEAAMGSLVTCSADVVGLSYMIYQVVKAMVCKPYELQDCVQLGMSRNESERPTLHEFLRNTRSAIQFY
ncbi:serine/threonine-protein kinase PrkC-like [Procambarus clarkii]|uniref:serine/threonine-protein kinase PrkC-like n=1 Tax=Procambarus clarkii TaxID=6728 RepID=UPI001E676F53|nr:serine/threonine-protein kinase pkn3-like [Procambarus clarkii]